MKNKLLWLSFGLIALTGVLHWIGNAFYLYWDSFWFDGLMHLLGGLVIGLLFIWVWYASGWFEKSAPTKRAAMASAVVMAMFVGLGWELFEYAYGISVQGSVNYAQDTFHDLVFDFLGAVLAGFIGRARSFHENV